MVHEKPFFEYIQCFEVLLMRKKSQKASKLWFSCKFVPKLKRLGRNQYFSTNLIPYTNRLYSLTSPVLQTGNVYLPVQSPASNFGFDKVSPVTVLCMYVCLSVCLSVGSSVRNLPVIVFEQGTWNSIHIILVDLEKNEIFIFSNFKFLRIILPQKMVKKARKKK